jgi:hypothetical protein
VVTRRLTHAVLPYRGEAEFFAGAVPFLQEGLARGDVAVAVAARERLRALGERLGDSVRLEESHSWYEHPARTLVRCLNEADELAAGGRRLRLVAEPVWEGRSALEVGEWQRAEAVVNVAFAGTGASILCAYDLLGLAPEILDGARRSHPTTMRGSASETNHGYMYPWAYTSTIDRLPLPPPPERAEAWRVDASDLYWLRAYLREYVRDVGLSGWRLQCLLMAVTEVVTNALRHGQPPVVLRLWTDGADVVCETVNGGWWRPAPGYGLVPPAPAAPGRFGMWAVRLLCSTVQVRTGSEGTTVRLRVPASDGSVSGSSNGGAGGSLKGSVSGGSKGSSNGSLKGSSPGGGLKGSGRDGRGREET